MVGGLVSVVIGSSELSTLGNSYTSCDVLRNEVPKAINVVTINHTIH